MMRSLTLPSRLARTSCSVLALATVLVVGASPAVAQSFQGTGSFTTNGGGVANISAPPGTTTTITVNPGQTVIDWSPFDASVGNFGAIGFQYSGTTATFTGASNYAVLNRINPADSTRTISMDGIINSFVNGVQGGSIYFYSPSGFVLGQNSRINVGSLVLSASPITVDVNGNFINGANNSVIFGQAPRAGAAITTVSGSQITANSGDAYVAMVAPRVQHGGNINVTGSAALVGAEAATINFSPDGLFDIQVTTGSTDGQGVVVNGGTITGTASDGTVADIHRAYLVAVPKNQAMTMLLTGGGTLGFDIAGVANAVGNTVVLSAGKDIVGGQIQSSRSPGSGTGDAGIAMFGVNTTSALVSDAVHNNIINASGSTVMNGNVTINSDRLARIYAATGTSLTINGNVEVSGSRDIAAGQTGTAANAEIWAYGGAITLNGNVLVTADAIGGNGVAGANATGGFITIQTGLGGIVQLNGNAELRANGLGANGGGSGTGGNPFVGTYDAGSQLNITGALTVNANGIGGAGGNGRGGFAVVSVADGTAMTVGGNLSASATGTGGDGVIGGNANNGQVWLRALSGGDLNLLGASLFISTDATGGEGSNGNGGNAIDSGITQIYADGVGSTINIVGATTISANATGGTSQSSTGGNASAGNLFVYAQNGGALAFTTSLSATADARGGTGVSAGGTALNTGDVNVFSTATLTVGGALFASARSTGGDVFDTASLGVIAGNGTGGRVTVYAQNGTLDLVGGVTLTSDGMGGGAGGLQDRAGNGTGGESRLFVNAGGSIDLGSILSSSALGLGGQLFGTSALGGNGQGGAVRVQATAANSAITIGGAATLNASGYASTGGECFLCESGGNGTGGTVWADSFGAATASLDFLSDVALYAEGHGGDGGYYYGGGGNGGNGQGGQALLQASAGSSVSVGGNATVSTDASGGDRYDSANGAGGNATGGVSRIQTFNGTGTGAAINIDGGATVSANGNGGASSSSSGGLGGDGTGGSAQLFASTGTITIGDAQTNGGASLSANGEGGTAFSGLSGDGFGGTAQIFAGNLASLTIAGLTQLDANGVGGGNSDASGNGGLGDGGLANVYSAGGDITFNDDVMVSALAIGGSTSNGLGGAALGGTARLGTDAGDILVTGTLTLNGSSTGGAGSTGGNAVGLVSAPPDEVGPVAAAIYVGSGGAVSVSGATAINAGATGGTGSNGNGGNATAGETDIVAYVGNITLAGLSLDANGLGGAGGLGGTGGFGTGGVVDVAFGLGAAPVNGVITIADATITANGTGGAGGLGTNAGTGGNGGAGGAGTGGGILFIGSAAGGSLQGGNTTLSVVGAGGAGGGGGNGDGGNGGSGGAGGNAAGGFILTGTLSAQNSPGSGGDFDVGNLSINANAIGGNGGNGGIGGGNGGGGTGGNATGGESYFLIRGVAATADAVSLFASATGGNGGTGSSVGNGGNAKTGLMQAESKDRFGFPSQRGSLFADSITATGIATGGSGANAGTETVRGGSYFRILNGDATIGSVSFTIAGDLYDDSFYSDYVSVRDGTATIGSFSYSTTGGLALDANNGAMNATTIALNAGSFRANRADVPTPTIVGTYSAGSFAISTGGDFITNANLASQTALSIVAPGLINAANMNVGANIFLDAQGGAISVLNLTALGNVDLTASGAITAGNVTAGGYIDMLAGGNFLIGNALAGEYIDLETTFGTLTALNLTSGDSVEGHAPGAISVGNVSAGFVDPSTSPTAEYSAIFLGGGAITIGDIDALEFVLLGTPGTLTAGEINAGGYVLGLVSGNMSFGPITTGVTDEVYLASHSMLTAAGPGFDPLVVMSAVPVASVGSILIQGAVSTGSFTAAAGTTLTGTTINANTSIYAVSGGDMTLTDLDAGTTIFQRSNGVITENDLAAGGFIDIRSAGGMALGDLVAGNYIDLRSNAAIGLGNATSGETINFLTLGSVTGLAMTAGDSVLAEAGGAIMLGAVTAGITDRSISPTAEHAARFSSGGAITTGDVNATGRIGFGTPTNLVTGDLTTFGGLMALVGGNMTAGAIIAGDYVYLANHSMSALGGAFATFDRAPILALAPVATGGSIALGSVLTGDFRVAAGTTLTGTTIFANGLLQARSGGNMSLTDLATDDGDILLTSGANIAVGDIASDDDVVLVAAGSISTLDIVADDDISADAGTTLTSGDITGNSIDLFADGNIATGDLLTRTLPLVLGQLVPGVSISVHSGGNVVVGTIDAIDAVHVTAVGTITTATIDAQDFVELFAGGNITAGSIDAGDYIDISSDTGLLDLANLKSGNQIELEAARSIDFGDATAVSFDFDSGGAVTGGNIVAVNNASGSAQGAITLQNITVTGPPIEDNFSVGMASATSINVSNVNGRAHVGFATFGNLTTGNLTSGGLVLAMVGGDIDTGSITTPGNGRVYLADASMFETGGGIDNFDESIVLALAPVATGGSIDIGGPVITGQFQAAAGDNLVARAITAQSIEASAGGTAALDGIWRAPVVTLASRDINITANGGIDAGSAGEVTLNAVNDSGGAVIGDGVTGPGYALSNAEFGRISGGDITIIVGGNGGDADTLIGDLTITGPLAGSNIESNGGGVHFITLDEAGNEFDGTLRIVGDVVATGFGPDNYLAFYTQNFELDAATGSISITGNGGALAGTLELYASRIHVAEGAILDRLATDPQYAGYREDLNRQAAVQRPEGVIRAANFDIEFGGSDITGPYTLFVQNMGTTAVPAGFLLNAANIGDDGEGSVAAGSIDMAINGQVITESGTLTGVAVRDLLVTEFGTEAFAAGSTINGCPLTGSCSAEPLRVHTLTSSDVQLNDGSGLGDGLFGNEGDIDDGASGDESDRSSPIAAPDPLFDSRPLSASDDVDDPVSGAGNPSLFGAGSDEEGGVEVCDGVKDNQCKTSAKGDGK